MFFYILLHPESMEQKMIDYLQSYTPGNTATSLIRDTAIILNNFTPKCHIKSLLIKQTALQAAEAQQFNGM